MAIPGMLDSIITPPDLSFLDQDLDQDQDQDLDQDPDQDQDLDPDQDQDQDQDQDLDLDPPHLSRLMQRGSATQMVPGGPEGGASIVAQAESEDFQEFSPSSTRCPFSRPHRLPQHRILLSDSEDEGPDGASRPPQRRPRRGGRPEGGGLEGGGEAPVIRGLWVQEVDWLRTSSIIPPPPQFLDSDSDWESDSSQDPTEQSLRAWRTTVSANEGLLFHHLLRPRGALYREGREYRLLHHIQNGAYGDVFCAQDNSSGFRCAAKRVPVGVFSSEELSTWILLDSPRVIQLFGAVREGPNVVLFMDLKPACLAQLLRGGAGLPEDLALHYLLQTLGALQHLHQRQVLHLDVKAENLLLSADCRDAFLCDFGLSERLDASGRSRRAFRGGAPPGTETHMAPEVAGGERPGAEADVWSSCCLLLHLLNGVPPWTRFYGPPLCLQIATGPPPLWEVPSRCNNFTAQLFAAGLQKDAGRRASARQLRRKTTKALRAVGGLSPSSISAACQRLWGQQEDVQQGDSGRRDALLAETLKKDGLHRDGRLVDDRPEDSLEGDQRWENGRWRNVLLGDVGKECVLERDAQLGDDRWGDGVLGETLQRDVLQRDSQRRDGLEWEEWRENGRWGNVLKRDGRKDHVLLGDVRPEDGRRGDSQRTNDYVLQGDGLIGDVLLGETLQRDVLQRDVRKDYGLQRDVLAEDVRQGDGLLGDVRKDYVLERDTLLGETLQRDSQRRDVRKEYVLLGDGLEGETLQRDSQRGDVLLGDERLKNGRLGNVLKRDGLQRDVRREYVRERDTLLGETLQGDILQRDAQRGDVLLREILQGDGRKDYVLPGETLQRDGRKEYVLQGDVLLGDEWRENGRWRDVLKRDVRKDYVLLGDGLEGDKRRGNGRWGNVLKRDVLQRDVRKDYVLQRDSRSGDGQKDYVLLGDSLQGDVRPEDVLQRDSQRRDGRKDYVLLGDGPDRDERQDNSRLGNVLKRDVLQRDVFLGEARKEHVLERDALLGDVPRGVRGDTLWVSSWRTAAVDEDQDSDSETETGWDSPPGPPRPPGPLRPDWDSESGSETDLYMGEDESTGGGEEEYEGDWEEDWEEGEEEDWEEEEDWAPPTEPPLRGLFPLLRRGRRTGGGSWGSEEELKHLRDEVPEGTTAQSWSPEPRDDPPSCFSCSDSSQTEEDSERSSDDLSSGVFSSCDGRGGGRLDWAAPANRASSCCFDGVDIWIELVRGECLRIREQRRVKVGHVAIGISDQVSRKAFTLETLDRRPVPCEEEVRESGRWLCCVSAPDGCQRWRWRIRDGKLELRE